MSKRDAILEAALQLFAERGFHGTAVPLVAERAGVGAGTLYRYFDSKEALVNALYQRWKLALSQALVSDFPAAHPAREQFREVWRRLFRFAARHPVALRFLELHHHVSYLDDESRRLDRKLVEVFAGLMVPAQRDGVLKDAAPERLIALVYGGFVGLLKGAWAGFYALDQAVVDEGEGCMWEAIRKGESKPWGTTSRSC